MARPINQSNTWDFQVQSEPAYFADGTKINGLSVNRRSDTLQSVGTVSETGYGIVQNPEFIATIRASLNGLGLADFQEDILTTRDGSRLFATYTWKNRQHKLAKVGDTVGMRLRFNNSFDGSLSLMGEAGALVLRCTNGMVGFGRGFALEKQRHSAKISLDFASKVIGQAAEKWEDSLQIFNRLATVPVNEDQGIFIIKNMSLADKTETKLINLWLRPTFAIPTRRTLYGVLDTVTEFVRDIPGFEQSERVNRLAMKHISKGLTPDGFADITAIPIESPQMLDMIKL